jgi:hypothetical protein
MTTRLPLILASATILAATLALTGCAAGTGSSGGSQAAPGAGGSAGDGSKVCSLASVADAQGAIKADPELTAQIEGAVDSGGVDCGYASTDNSILVNVIVYPKSDDFTLTGGVLSGEALSPVSGIGDKAAAGDFELNAVVGGKGLVVTSLGPTDLSRDQVIALGKLVASRLGR